MRANLAIILRCVGLGTLLTANALAAAPPPNGALYDLLGAPPDWSLSGAVRIRGEGIDNNFRPAPVAPATGMFSTRSTLFAEYHPGPFYAGLEVFDSRAYFEGGRSSVSTTEINTFELGQAFLGWRGPALLTLPGRIDVDAGRFTIDDGSRRLIERGIFRNTFNGFTGARLEWTDAARDRLFLFWTMPQARLPSSPEKLRENAAEFDLETPDVQFFGGSLTKAGVLGGTFEAHAYWLQENDRPDLPTRNRHLTTPGARLFRAPKPGQFDWDMEGAWQTGHQRATTSPTDRHDLATDAYFFHLQAGYTFAAPWQPRAVLKYDQASGNGRDRGRWDRFDSLYGARDFDFGPTSLYGALARSNIRDIVARLELTPSRRLKTEMTAREVWLESATDALGTTGVRDPTGRSGRLVGTQVEWHAGYWLAPGRVKLDTGLVFLLKEGFLRDAPNAPPTGDTTYAFMDLTFDF